MGGYEGTKAKDVISPHMYHLLPSQHRPRDQGCLAPVLFVKSWISLVKANQLSFHGSWPRLWGITSTFPGSMYAEASVSVEARRVHSGVRSQISQFATFRRKRCFTWQNRTRNRECKEPHILSSRGPRFSSLLPWISRSRLRIATRRFYRSTCFGWSNTLEVMLLR